MKTEIIVGIAVIALIAVLLMFTMVGGPVSLSGNYRDFWQSMGTKDIGQSSTFSQDSCLPNEGEDCVILSGHWENINAQAMTGTYILYCRCYRQEG